MIDRPDPGGNPVEPSRSPAASTARGERSEARIESRLRDRARLRTSIAVVNRALTVQLETIEGEPDPDPEREEAARRDSLAALAGFAQTLSESLWLESEIDSLGDAVSVAPQYHERAQALLLEHDGFTRDLARIHADALVTQDLADWRQLTHRFERLTRRLALHDAAENEIVTNVLFDELGTVD